MIKTRLIKTAAAFLTVLTLLAAESAIAAGAAVYTNTRMLANNLEYTDAVSWESGIGRVESFSVKTTGAGDAYPIVMNGDTVYGGFNISKMTDYAKSQGKSVLAAINTDFFASNAVPIGVVIEDGVYKSGTGGRNAVAFDKDGNASVITAPTVWISLHNDGGSESSDNTGKSLRMRNFNKTRTDTGGMVLYSEAFSTVSTRTSTPGWFVRFKILEGTPSAAGVMKLEVTETAESEGEIPIGAGYLVLTAAEKSNIISEYEKFAVGDKVTLTTTCTDERLANARYATGGGDILVADGAVTDHTAWSSSLQGREPRTAFGVTADGSVLAYVADGRDSNHSVGLTLRELANKLLQNGCVSAINMDGGGSSALSVRVPGDSINSVVSSPSDGAERRCATYIVFVTDIKPGGAAANLCVRNDGTIVLANSTLNLEFGATDKGYMPVPAPQDIAAETAGAGASVSGTLYTAGAAGLDRLSLYSPSTGAKGSAEVFVIATPTSLTAYAKGSKTPLTAVRVSSGETLELEMLATYYRRAVSAQAESFTYGISGDIGTITKSGVFTAGETISGTGAITISAGGVKTDIKVEVGYFTDMTGHWARAAADYLWQAGVVKGVTETQFGPNQPMKRCDYMVMLHRAAGAVEIGPEESFADVPVDSYYAKAMSWAKLSGIAQGSGDNTFNPQAPLTRQDAFTFTYRTLSLLGKKYTDGTAEDLAGFPDYGSVSEYAVVPAATLVKLGVVGGIDGNLAPQGILTRAQMAKILTVILKTETGA